MSKFLRRTVMVLPLLLTTATFAQDGTEPQQLVYMIGNYDIIDQAVYEQYMTAAAPELLTEYGGRLIVYNLEGSAVEGKPRSVIAIAEFPSIEDAQAFYNSPEYTAARQYRIASTEGSIIFTEGLPL